MNNNNIRVSQFRISNVYFFEILHNNQELSCTWEGEILIPMNEVKEDVLMELTKHLYKLYLAHSVEKKQFTTCGIFEYEYNFNNCFAKYEVAVVKESEVIIFYFNSFQKISSDTFLDFINEEKLI
jgi:hypothetical protein